MIAYDELCSALARWRSRQGLPNGPSSHPPHDHDADATGHDRLAVGADDDHTAQHAMGQATAERTLTSVSAAPDDELPPPPEAGGEHDDSTGEHFAAPLRVARPGQRDDITGELDVDSIDLLDEEEM